MGTSKRVKRISSEGEVIFESGSDAERSTPGASRTLIGRAARQGLTHAGYRWEYTEEMRQHSDKPSVTLSEAQIREMFDMRTIVFKELSTLKRGEFWRDNDFVRKFQGRTGFRSILETPEASIYKGKNQGHVFWSHPESIAKMKQEGILI